MPELNEARRNAGACSLGANVYVVAGNNGNRTQLNSIEKLICPAESRDKKACWQLISVCSSILSPRYDPIVVPLNTTEFAILGGYGGHSHYYLTDVILFEVKTEECKKVVSKSLLKFCAIGNQAA